MNQDVEQKVKDILQKDSWQILPNAYYTDPNTGKPREKDVIASKTQFPDIDSLHYEARLFIECKNFPNATRIHTRGIRSTKNTLFPVNVPFANISEIERSRQTHFYEYGEVFNLKDSGDFLHIALNQNLQSFAAFRKSKREQGLFFLLVVYSGEIISIDQAGNNQKRDYALIQVDALDETFDLPNGQCLIEVVSLDKFEEILKKIKADIDRVNSSASFYFHVERNRADENRRQRANEARKNVGL